MVNEVFEGRITFHHAGLSPIETDDDKSESPLRKQLKHFYNSLIHTEIVFCRGTG